MNVEPMDDHLNPDCRAGAHRACSGEAWDVEADEQCPCGCECHEATNVADLPDYSADRAA